MNTTPTPADLKHRLSRRAHELGFDMLRVAPADAARPQLPRLEKWLSHGYAGDMAYLERNPAGRCDPDSLLPGCRSVVVTATGYYHELPGWPAEGRARVARYAWGDDYHDIIRPRLKELGRFLDQLAPGNRWKETVDTSPLHEKSLAVAAGIGWQGKNSLVLNRDLGSYLFLGLLLTTVELPADEPAVDNCGSCKACLEICPSGALEVPRVLAANKCISYLTTEQKEPPRPGTDLSGWLYGCDLCQLACPVNEAPRLSREPAFAPNESTAGITAAEAASLSEAEFEQRFARSPIKRRHHDRFTAQALRLLETGSE